MRKIVRAMNCLALLILLATPVLAERLMTEMDLHKFVWIADPQISPDGSQIVFVRVSVNAKGDGYDTALWTVPAGGKSEPARLTAGPHDTSPRWTRDGKRLAFIRAVDKDGKTQPTQVFFLDMTGGEARQLTDLPKGAASPAWSPDGKTILFTSTTLPEDSQPNTNTGYKSDVRVITHAVYRSNGPGYIDPSRHTHTWTIPVNDAASTPAKPKQLTSGEYDEQSPAWSTDGSRIYFISTRVAEPYYEPHHNDLYSIPAAGGEMTKVTGIDGTIAEFAPSPDGKRIAFIGALNGHPVRSYDQPDLFVADATSGAAPRNLTAEYDFDISGGLSGDQAAPRASRPSGVMWTKDGQSLLVVAAERGRANLKRINATSDKIENLTTGDQDVMNFAVSENGKIALLISTPTNIGDLFAVDSSGKLAQLTHINQALFSEIKITAPEEFTYKSFDGKTIQGWIQKPPDFDPSKKYPAILEIHGGPHSAYGATFTHEFQWMAAKGYVVVYVNPRGSTSYGQDFGNIIQYHYPGDDYRDLMLGVDEALKRGYIEPQRLGVTGGSGGGLLTNWVVTQTNRFKAAVSQRSIADWSGFWFTADFHLFQPTWFTAAPWENPQDFIQRSPITFIKNVTTPLLLIEGESDMRTPPADGGEQMFRALKYLKKETEMVRFPDETHELSRSGKPWHRVERLQHIVGWFDKYLKKTTSN